MMRATMMDHPTNLQLVFRHGRAVHPDSVVATFDGDAVSPARFADIADRAEKLSVGLAGLGVQPGDRVATFAWNHREHMEAYLAIPCMGAVMHTLNIRLFADQISYIIRHADDRVLLVDGSLLPLLERVDLADIEHVVMIGEGDPAVIGRDVIAYEDLLASADGVPAWPDLDDTSAAAVCYTSGTTGDPKGVVYSHRSSVIHSMATRAVDTFGICEADRILLLPPMFHANAWGLPYAAWMSGSDLVMPREFLSAPVIGRLVGEERITFTAAVPTLLNDLLAMHEESPLEMSSLRVIVSGGSAVAPALIDRIRDTWGVPVLQGWGMTETSPMCCLSTPPKDTPTTEQAVWRAKSGRPVPGMEVRVVDDDGSPLAHDGETVGELQLRGPWVTGAYHDNPAVDSFTADGWLRTGDVGVIDERFYVRLTDRTKDVIKSGGEWISSVELENVLVAHGDVHEVSVIAVPDDRWEERPLAVVVRRPGTTVTAGDLRGFLVDKVARWWIPERWSFADELPKTSVGKVDKLALRAARDAGSLDIEEFT
jgi:fatty-acyl-CoA synthase